MITMTCWILWMPSSGESDVDAGCLDELPVHAASVSNAAAASASIATTPARRRAAVLVDPARGRTIPGIAAVYLPGLKTRWLRCAAMPQ